MGTRIASAWQALVALGAQLLLVLDQLGNVILPGLLAVLMAALTGRRQNVAYADETLSAHAWRAYARGRIWGVLLKPVIDAMFFWQQEDGEVNVAAGRAITGHCERAFWKEKLRRNFPPEYRDDPPKPAP